MKTAETMYDPFGEDEEDFNICDLLERHLRSLLRCALKRFADFASRAGNVYVTDSEDSLEIMDLLSENEVFINNNDLKETLMSNIQDIKGVKRVF